MDIDTMKQLIKKYEPGHTAFVTRADIAERYYRNETDILPSAGCITGRAIMVLNGQLFRLSRSSRCLTVALNAG